MRFGEFVALTGIDMVIPKAARVAVLGPNGAGKSTLLEVVAGTLPPSDGSIERGSDRMALVPQGLEVEPVFPATVTDVVRMGRYGDLGLFGRFGPRDRELVAKSIEELGIAEIAERRFSRLSGGQRQRALLAQAAAQEADILLLDEPFTGVDAPTRAALRGTLDRWSQEGRTVLVATHDLESAARDYDLVLCVNRRLIAFGPAAQTCTTEVLEETFAGGVIKVGELLIDATHHHHGAA